MNSQSYQLEERLTNFSIAVVDFCKSIELDTITRPIVSQLVRSSSSIGANYCEANNASSKKDFANKIYICKKESQETKYWLRIIIKIVVNHKDTAEVLFEECQQFVLIFQKIIFTMKNK